MAQIPMGQDINFGIKAKSLGGISNATRTFTCSSFQGFILGFHSSSSGLLFCEMVASSGSSKSVLASPANTVSIANNILSVTSTSTATTTLRAIILNGDITPNT